MSDLSNTCFMCLNTRDELVDKSEESNTVHYLQYVIPELFIMDSKVPQQICKNCQETLHSFYKFKKMCLENCCRLRNNTKNLQEVSESQSNHTEKSFIEKKFDNANSKDADLLLSPKKLQHIDVNERFSEEDCEVDNLEKCRSPDVTNDNKNNTHDTGKISKSFECSICNKRFSSKQYLTFHLKLHSGSVDIHCKVCNKCFPCRSQLKDHMALHTGTKDFECSVCYKKFGYPSNLKEHMKIHTDTKKYKCSVCSKMFLRNCDLKIHSKIHSNTQESFIEKKSPKKLQLVNERFSEEECEVDNLEKCSIPDVTNDNVNNTNDTGKIKSFECSKCNKRYSNKEYLKLHFKLHTGSEIRCEVCNKRFLCRSQLKQHMPVHTGVKAFECSVCNKKFRFASNLRDHRIVHSATEKHKCSVCSKMFARKRDLAIHAKIHSSKQDFECTICEKKFVVKSRLNTHLKIHTNVKDLKCTICFKEFAYKKSLDYHMSGHTGEKNFQCNLCNRKFARKDNMHTHIMRHHRNK